MASYSLPHEWALQMCKVKEAWDLPLPSHGEGKAKGEGIIIAHPDTGYTLHPELIKGDRYEIGSLRAKSFMSRDSRHISAEDTLSGLHPSHGTSTASVIFSGEGHPNSPPLPKYPDYAGGVATGPFVTGVAPMAKILPLRVVDTVLLSSFNIGEADSLNTYATLARALLHIIKLKDIQIGVVSISLGGVSRHRILNNALNHCRKKGIIVIAAAGQVPGAPELITRRMRPSFPGSSPHTICVAGCYKDYSRPLEGFYGNEVDITTPGWNVNVAKTEGERTSSLQPARTRTYSINTEGRGTSYATAFTAGACALWLAHHNRAKLIRIYGKPLLFDLFRHCLLETVDTRSGSWSGDRGRGRGVLNVEALLRFELPEVEVVESIATANHWPRSEWGAESEWGRS